MVATDCAVFVLKQTQGTDFNAVHSISEIKGLIKLNFYNCY